MAGPHLALLPLALLAGDPGQVAPTAPPPADPDATQVALTELAERYTVPVRIAGSGPYRFVIDTGAERTVISRQLASTLGLPAGRMVNVIAMSGTSRVGTVVIPSLTMSSVPDIGAIHAPALDAHHLGGLGLLGIDTLQHHKISIDFDTEQMTVTPSAKRKHSEPADRDEIVVRAKSLFGQLIVTDAEIEGRSVRVIIDTGSPVSVGNSALRRLVSRHARGFKPMEMTSATGGRVDTRYTRADKLRVGGIEFVGMPIAFSDVPPFERFGVARKPAMLLGMNALKFFRRVEIDFPNREVRFRMPRRNRMAYKCTASFNGECAA